MAKLSKEEISRREGMAYALKIAEEKGIEGLREEIRQRNINNIPIGVNKQDFEELKNTVRDCILILSVATLSDEFDFDKDKISQFMKRFNLKSECIAEDYCNWEDVIEGIKDDINIELTINNGGK